MPIAIINGTESTYLFAIILLAGLLLSVRKTTIEGLLTVEVSQELKGLAILAIVFAHISYMLVSDHHFLYPLNRAAGVGVDIFLFMSGYGLTVSMMKKPLTILEFYKRRLIKVFIPFWLVLLGLFVVDALALGIHHSPSYMIQSMLGWFPKTRPYEDVNSPFWYITWMLLFYVLFPLLFNQAKPWLTALLLSVIANLLTHFNPLSLDTNWWQQMHTDAFSLGILLAWLLRNTQDSSSSLAMRLTKFRAEFSGLGRYGFLMVLTVIAAYMAASGNTDNWPFLAQTLRNTGLISDTHFIGQTTSLVSMAALIIVFILKKLDIRLLGLFGNYSYEIYLLHWPLMARYDVFFHHLPPWLATVCWLLALLAVSWGLQRITQPLGAWLDSRW